MTESGASHPNQRVKELMMAAVDDEISTEDRAELDVALAAGKRTHLLPACVPVGVVGRRLVSIAPLRDAGQVRDRVIACRERGHAEDESGACHADAHGVRVVAVDAGVFRVDFMGELNRAAPGFMFLHGNRKSDAERWSQVV